MRWRHSSRRLKDKAPRIQSEIGLESTEETPEAQSVGDGSRIGPDEGRRGVTGEEQQAILFRIKEVMKRRTREALPSMKACAKRIVQTEITKVNNVVQ